jgi:enoyl-CoA hydratase/carnithine racemase
MLFPAFADFTIAADDASFSMPNVHLGTSPILEVLTLARTMSRSPVLRLALLGKHDRWSADRARQLGLVVEVTSRENLDTKIGEILETLTQRSAALAVRAARTGWWNTFPYPEGAGFNTHYLYMAEIRVASEDAKEGPRAFAEKRRPNWKAK